MKVYGKGRTFQVIELLKILLLVQIKWSKIYLFTELINQIDYVNITKLEQSYTQKRYGHQSKGTQM